jgi:type I restriction enzyme, R subunit
MDRETGEMRYGFAHHMRRGLPRASFVGFTGTPVELVNANTYQVFGDQIDVYDIAQAVEDGATVPIYYEARVAKIELADVIDEEFDEITEEADEETRAAARRRWGRVEALVGAEKRLDTVVADMLGHFDQRLEAIDGKAMIVCMSRRIAVEVYRRIVAARAGWHADGDDQGAVKVVMTGSATDPMGFQPHIRSKGRLEALRNRYRKPEDPLKLVIVCDMWLTGFDAPCMHTLYVDKPMKGHGLMQAIARVNRVFRNKPAGLVVDYIGLAADLKAALAHYSASDQARTGVDTRQAVEALMTALDVVRAMFTSIDYIAALRGTPADRLRILPQAIERALTIEREAAADDTDQEATRQASRRRFLDAAAALVKAFKLAAGTPEADAVKEEVGFFVAVQIAVQKLYSGSGAGRSATSADFAIGQLVNRAVASTEVIDILGACGMDRPDISVLSEEFLAEVRQLREKNLAVEALRKLLNGEIAARTRTNVVKHEEFSERLREAIARYHNRSVDALQVIQELINLARSLREQPDEGLSTEEKAFYDALAKNESAVEILGNAELLVIAAELVKVVRERADIDWWRRENVRSAMRIAVKRILRKHGFPPDLQDEAVRRVIQQAEALAGEFRRAA